jgi:DNA-binding SARP family transcriptional activator
MAYLRRKASPHREGRMIRLRTLGTLDLRGANGDELRSVLSQPRRAALLAWLALATPRGAQRRDSLLALFWPELDTDRARNALGQAVHFLRRAIGADAIVNRNGDGLGLDWSGFWCDAAAFEDALDAGRVGEAIALYRGDLLEGFHISDAPEFERWLDRERARLATRYTDAVEALASDREKAGDFHAAVTHWRALATRDPYSSRFALRLMRSLVAIGDPAGAVMYARQHERLLEEELSITPDAEVADLVRQIQSERPRGSVPLQVPAVVQTRNDTPVATATREIAPPSDKRRWSGKAIGAAALIIVIVAIVATLMDGAGKPLPPRAPAAVALQATPDDSYFRALIVRGRNAEISRSKEGLAVAKEAYERAIALDPTSALGHAGLASVYELLAWYRFLPQQPALDSARVIAQRAFALDSFLPDSRSIVARTLADDGRFAEAERHLKRAIALDSTDGRAHYWYAALLVTLGRGADAMREAKLAEKLDPLGPKTLAWQRHAHWLLTGDRPHLKIPPRERRPILKLEPGEPWARARQAEDLAEVGECAAARDALAQAQRLAPDNVRMRAPMARIDWWCGERPRARALLEGMKRAPDAAENGFEIALLHTFFAEPDSALAWLDRRQRWSLLDYTLLSTAPYFDPLRSDERFSVLLRKLGLRAGQIHR